jgi:hypothetical protein
MMRRGFRYEDTESNVENVSLVRHLIPGMQVTMESEPFKTIQSAWKTLKPNRNNTARGAETCLPMEGTFSGGYLRVAGDSG